MIDNVAFSHSEVDHTKVAPTAYGVSYLRTFTDIPLSKEFFEALNARLQAVGEPDIATRTQKDHLAPQLEARYKLVDRLILQSSNAQVLELAAGIATHGINLTQTHSDLTYVELDLPEVVNEKHAVLTTLGIRIPANLSIKAGNALHAGDVEQAAAGFSLDRSLTVVNEGLMRYLTFDEKTTLATIVHNLLTRFGGTWVTPDISLRAALSRENEAASGHTESLKHTTGIDIDKNVFEDEAHAKEFFENLGFSVESHSFLEVSDQLVSPGRLNMSVKEVKRLNEPCVAFVMKLAS